MSDDFLNSYAFEQMAREYNKKYFSKKVDALSLKKDEELLLKVENIFNKVFRLFYLLKKQFIFDKRFKELFVEFDSLKQECVKKYTLIFNKPFNFSYLDYDKKINNDVFICLLLEVFGEFIDYDNISLIKLFNNIIYKDNEDIFKINYHNECENFNNQIFNRELIIQQKEVHIEIKKIFRKIIDLFVKFYTLV